jgi:NAD-dependent SIR2 family protein deacetylase
MILGTTEKQKCIGCGHLWVLQADEAMYRDYLIWCPKCQCRKTKPNVIFYGENCVKEYSEGNRILRKWCKSYDTMMIDVGSLHIVYKYATRIIKKGNCYKVLVNPDPAVPFHHHIRYNGDDWNDITKCLDMKLML